MASIIKEVQSNSSVVAAVLISGKPGCFIAGADIGMLGACKTSAEVYEISRYGNCIFINKYVFSPMS